MLVFAAVFVIDEVVAVDVAAVDGVERWVMELLLL